MSGTLLTLNEQHVKPEICRAPTAASQATPRWRDRQLHPSRAMLNAAPLATGLGLALAFAVLPARAQDSSRSGRLHELPMGGDVADTHTTQGALQVDDFTNDSAPHAASTPPTPRQLYEHVRRGVVIVARGGIPSALGTVLAGDGRILTALSGLGGAPGADVRYADGTEVHAKLGYSDKALDLALLTPDSGRRTEGLTASEVDPADTQIRAMLPGRGAHLGPAVVGVKGHADAHAHGGAALLRMWDVDVQGVPVVGAPLLDPSGSVVAVLVRACKGPPQAAPPSPGAWPTPVAPSAGRGAGSADTDCRSVVVGAPVSAVRSFLASASGRALPRASLPTSSGPWLGIRGEPEEAAGMHGVRVVDVAPSSPAEKAGLKPTADVIVAVDGRPIERPDALGESISKHAIGDSVKLLVFGGGKFREVSAVLRGAPPP